MYEIEQPFAYFKVYKIESKFLKMKKFFYLIFTLAIAFSTSTSLLAQQTDNAEKTVKLTVVTKDGTTITKEIQYSGDTPTEFEHLDFLDPNDIQSIDVELIGGDAKICDPKNCTPRPGCMPKGSSNDDGGANGFKNRIKDRNERWGHRFSNPVRPMLGVYVDENYQGEGMKLDNVIQGKGAADAGLQRGDIIIKVGETNVENVNNVSQALGQLEVGDKVCVKYNRNGSLQRATVTLTPNRPSFVQRYAYTYEEDKKVDPCKVFIGVYTKNHREGGVKVTEIIKDTPASNMDLQKGDIILAIDGSEVNSQPELVSERDENQPGDYFKLTILRDGERKKVRGQFKACDKQEDIIETTQPEIEMSGQGFNYERFEAFPNPTFGEVNIAFAGKSVPTIIRLTDVSGKVVYEESIQNFDGIYQKQVQLRNKATPGAVSLTVIQEGQAVSKSIVLLNRA